MSDGLPGGAVGLVLHFRDERRTARCLDSLLADGVRRVVIVDNSQDAGASIAALSARIASWATSGLAIEVEAPARNLGFSAGVNLGLRVIRQRHGPVHVLLLNSDAVLRPGAHSAMREVLHGRRPSIAAACMVDAAGRTTPFAFYQRLCGLLTRKPLPGAHRYLSACCLMIHPDLAMDGLFDEDFFFYGEDIELGWRLSRLGIGQVAVGAALVDHEGSASSRIGSLFYEYHMAMAHMRLPAKLSGLASLRLCMALARCVVLPLRAAVRSGRFRSLAPCRGLALAVADIARGRSRDLTPPAPDPTAEQLPP